MALTHVGSFTLGEINLGIMASLGFLNPMLAQFDIFLHGQFGLGLFLADIQLQYSAAISAVTQMQLSLANPLLGLQALLTAYAQIQASLAVAMAFGLPTISAELLAQIAAVASLAAEMSLKIGGLKAVLSAGAAVKTPALRFVGEMAARLNAGPVHLLSFTGSSLAATGADIAGQFTAGLGPDDPIPPLTSVSGLLLVTQDPAVFAALGAILRVN